MTADAPKCITCKNYIGSNICKAYGKCLDKVYRLGKDCKKYVKGKNNAN